MWLDLSICHKRVITDRCQCASRAQVGQEFVFGDDCIQSFPRCLIFIPTKFFDLPSKNGCDHIPELIDAKLEGTMQESFCCGGVRPTCHHHFAEAAE